MRKDQNQIVESLKSVTEIMKEMTEDNDRSVVIVGAAHIDYLLKKILVRSLLPPIKPREDELLEGDTPLATFSARINMAYRMALIDKEFARSLHLLRKIRNSFAHEPKTKKLTDSPHSDRVSELLRNIEQGSVLTTLKSHFAKNGIDDQSLDFRIIISLMVAVLELKSRNLPKSIKANPASITWIPSDVCIESQV